MLDAHIELSLAEETKSPLFSQSGFAEGSSFKISFPYLAALQ